MLISKFGTATINDIISFNRDLPNEYVRFLKKYNGGETPETQFNINGICSDIVAFYGIGDVKYSLNKVDIIEEKNDKYLPIAFDSFGNQIVISIITGCIFFYDHEQCEITKKLAQTLSDFISKVISDKINPKHTKPIFERENDLIRRGRAGIITDELRLMWQKEIEKYTNYNQENVSF